MARIPDTTINEIRERIDIVDLIGRHLSLKSSGRNFVGLCPFHNEKTPSFNVNRERQIDDGRVVLVRLTEAGAAALDELRCRASAALGALLVELPDSEVASLAVATETMGRLVTLLQQGR